MDFDVPIQTTLHVVISLVAIASGADSLSITPFQWKTP